MQTALQDLAATLVVFIGFMLFSQNCDTRYECPLRERCWAFLPEHSVMELYRGKAKGLALLDRGVKRLTRIPEDCSITENQRIQIETVKSSMPRVSKLAIRRFLQDLNYPAILNRDSNAGHAKKGR